jgi:hypothetical protein
MSGVHVTIHDPPEGVTLRELAEAVQALKPARVWVDTGGIGGMLLDVLRYRYGIEAMALPKGRASFSRTSEGVRYQVEGPDDDLAAYYAKDPERWRGEFFVVQMPNEPVRRAYQLHELPRPEGTGPILRWVRVTDPAVLARVV